MADQAEQVERPVDTNGILRVDTGEQILSIPFEDLMRFPRCPLTRCIEGTESNEVVIQIERDTDLVSIILSYMQDKSEGSLEQILDQDWKFMSMMAEEAEYFLLDGLEKECKKAIEAYGMGKMKIGLITSEQQAFAIYERACRERIGLIFINRSSNEMFRRGDAVLNDLRLLDHDNVDVYTVVIEGFDPGELMAFKLPRMNNLRRYTTTEDESANIPAFVYRFNLGIESPTWDNSHLFSGRRQKSQKKTREKPVA